MVNGGLFDIHADPAEKTDLSGEQPEVVTRLTERFAAWEATLKESTGKRPGAGARRDKSGWKKR